MSIWDPDYECMPRAAGQDAGAHDARVGGHEFSQGGDRVARGEQIGRVGKSGNATGFHLHYEVHRGNQTVDPIAYLP